MNLPRAFFFVNKALVYLVFTSNETFCTKRYSFQAKFHQLYQRSSEIVLSDLFF